MRKLTISSARGGLIDLMNDDYFWLVDFDAETQNDNELMTATLAGGDGDIVNSVAAFPRTAIIELRIKTNVNVEEAKRHITQVIKPKQECTFRSIRDNRDVTLTGYVETISMPRYTNAVSLFTTFHCSQPFWEDFKDVVAEITNIDNLHYFTKEAGEMLYFPAEGIPLGAYDFARVKSFYNGGDVAVGMTIQINAVSTVTNPIIWASDGTYIGVNTTMKAMDVIEITTHRGRKTITKNGQNIITSLKAGSTWLQLETGQSEFNINSDDEAVDNMYFNIIYKQRYV